MKEAQHCVPVESIMVLLIPKIFQTIIAGGFALVSCGCFAKRARCGNNFIPAVHAFFHEARTAGRPVVENNFDARVAA